MILRRLDTRFHRAFFVQIFKQGYERAGLGQRAVQIRMVPATLAGGEESQVSSFPCLRDVDFLLSQPRSIFHCLVNILRFEIRVVLEDFLLGRAVSDLANDGRNKDTHAAHTCPATHDVGIERYAVKHRYPILSLFVEQNLL